MRKLFAKQHDIPHVFSDYEELAAMDELDAVSVCTPNNFHAGPTIAALNAGKHVICEKPIAANAIDGQAMVECAESERQSPTDRFYNLGSALSRVRCGNSTMKGFSATSIMRGQWRCDGAGYLLHHRFSVKPSRAGGPLIDIGCTYPWMCCSGMIGCPKPIEAFGMTATKFGHKKDVINPWGKWDPEDFEVEDFAMGTIRFEGGVNSDLRDRLGIAH